MEVTYSSDSCSDSDSRELWTVNLSNKRLSSLSLAEEFEVLERSDDVDTLLVHHNSLTFIPTTVSNFYCLRTLDVSSNHLTKLPEELFLCPLITLIAKNNKLTNESLPKTFLPGTENLREINLSGNLFQQFPEQLLELDSLKYLYLGGNQISVIPKDVRCMKSLQILSIPGNQITDVPKTVGSLQQLQALILYDNRIERIPSNVANLSNLKSLYLHNNKLKHLPRDIITLKNLEEVSLDRFRTTYLSVKITDLRI